MEKDGRKVPLYLERKQFACGSSCVAACIETWIRGGGTAVADELMEGVDITESHASSSADPAVETVS